MGEWVKGREGERVMGRINGFIQDKRQKMKDKRFKTL